MNGIFGSLIFGGYDTSKYTPNNVSFDLAPDVSRDIVVGLQSISLTDASRLAVPLLPSAILTFIDSTFPWIYLPIDACEAFEKELGLTWNETAFMYFINDTLHQTLIANNPSFTFTVGNNLTGGPTVDIVLPYASFDFDVISYPLTANETTHYFPLQRSTNSSQYTLGRQFLQEAYAYYGITVKVTYNAKHIL